ncbi:hypothetical protein GXP67_35685 [Rhodocytophaga rosea]|uniref:PorT family protein n=1 Tax=Rhodocytophaga rosea TaxID=2704465 RepID=A0A6C0GTX7_9BACT|nr:hypothetical protein [Rhodocytophaga rosea]QHT71635.1 hypothetical protein GXP67_35685 [Rhodocytophaga rosea]
MTRYCIFLFASFLYAVQVQAQHTLMLGVQTDLGAPVNQYAGGKNILRSHALSYHFQQSLSLQYQLWNRIGLEAGVAQNAEKWRMKDKDFEERHPGFVVDLRNRSHYYSYFANLRLLQPLSPATNLYIQGGYVWNQAGNKSLSETRLFVMDNENVTATSVYNPNVASIQAEAGFQFPGETHTFSIGVKFNTGRGNLLQGSYLIENQDGTIRQDAYTSKGSFIGLTARYAFVLMHRDKKIKPVKPAVPPSPVIVQTPAPPPPKETPKQVAGRDLQVTHSVTVTKKKVIVKVWDHQTVDGDRVSLNLNGKWVLENYTLDKKAHIMEIELNPGKNIFVLHALNLGTIKPNTAAIIIDDGTNVNQIVLESTLETSGTIEVTLK